MLIDTGAVGTSMAQDVSEGLQLKAIRIQETYGAGGLHRNPVFEAILGFSIQGKHGNLLSLSGEIQAMGIPRLQEYMRSLGLQTPDGFPSRMIGFLGRDLLRHATLTYEGSKGRFEFKLDLSTLQQTIVTS